MGEAGGSQEMSSCCFSPGTPRTAAWELPPQGSPHHPLTGTLPQPARLPAPRSSRGPRSRSRSTPRGLPPPQLRAPLVTAACSLSRALQSEGTRRCGVSAPPLLMSHPPWKLAPHRSGASRAIDSGLISSKGGR